MPDISARLFEEDKPLQEKCGLVALYSAKKTKQLGLALLGAMGVQHRGTHGAGIAYWADQKIYKYTNDGLLREIFTSKVIKRHQKKSNWLMTHCRYGTSGGYKKANLQPCFVKSKTGMEITVAHNGEFVGMHNVAKTRSMRFSEEISDTYIFAKLLAAEEGDDWDKNILHALDLVKGAYSVLIGIGENLYAARDPMGIRPLSIGKVKDQIMIASETHAFDKVGAKVEREIKKGEVLKISKNGIKIVRHGKSLGKHFCDFEWAYFSRPDSLLPPNGEGDRPSEWMSVSNFRERCGKEIAMENPVKNASFIVGVPDSGVAVSTGFANEMKIPYLQMIVRDHFDPDGSQRLFMRDEQMKAIKKKVLGKLSIVPEKRIWKDAIVVIGDDSIVRGNVSAQITRAVKLMGAKEVHWIIGYPPVMHRCHLGVSIRTREELIAVQQQGDVRKIAKAIGATSIRYISPRAFIKARLLTQKLVNSKLPENIFLYNGGCGGCVTGQYPVTKEGEYFSKDK